MTDVSIFLVGCFATLLSAAAAAIMVYAATIDGKD